MTNVSSEQECTNQCRSSQHGDIITAAITKRGISDSDLCSFLAYTCCRCESVVDSDGRTALQVAASCGRLGIVRWLVKCRHAEIIPRDIESGYTPLHRSIFYGKINVAIELMKLGASITECDNDSLTVLEHAMKDGLKPDRSVIVGELYCWGSNTNNLLGPQQARLTPEMLDIFHKEHLGEQVQQICVDQFHTVIVTASGKAYSCGHGQGGRLGLGDEKSAVIPHNIMFQSNQKGEIISCIQAAISRYHSIFLCSDGNIYTCGLNTYKVLGQMPPPERCLVPKPIKKVSKEVAGVCAGPYHSVIWGPEALYTWGLNAGQLGHKEGGKGKDQQFILMPKVVNIVGEVTISQVVASTGATAVHTKKGDVYVLHEYLCRKIASKQLDVVQITIVGGKLDFNLLSHEISKEYSKELKVAILISTGNVLLWQESDPQLCRCMYSINRAVIARQIHLNLNELLLVTDYGEAFKGVMKPRKKKASPAEKPQKVIEKSAFHKFLEKDDCIMITLQKVSKIHRALCIQSDPKGKDYCVIQAYPYRNFEFPEMAPSEVKQNLELCLEEADETDDIHDIIFKIDSEKFPAHKYIIASCSPYLARLMEEKKQKEIVLDVGKPEIFWEFLHFVYTGDCELTKCCEVKNTKLRKLCIVKQKDEKIEEIAKLEEENGFKFNEISAYEFYKKNKENKENEEKEPKNLKNPVRMLHEMAKRLECSELQKTLNTLDMEGFIVKHKYNCNYHNKPLKFDLNAHQELYDVTVKCKDDKSLKAHKCILSARLEYFNNMFSTRWSGHKTSEVTLPFPKSTADALLEYLYTDTLSSLQNKEMEHLFRVLILADQLFVVRLKEQCELLLSNLITLKNAVNILAFAHSYNAQKLKYCCMKFIILNMAAFLESRMLDELEDDLLSDLSDFYFQEKEQVWCRVITPYSTAVSDEIVLSIASAFPVSLDEQVQSCSTTKTSQKEKKRRSHKSSTSEKRNSSFSDHPDSVIQFPDVPETAEVTLDIRSITCNIPNRLKSIVLATEIVENEGIESDYTVLGSSSELGASFNDFHDFPQLSSPPRPVGNIALHSKSPPQRTDSKHKLSKLSQKQRKRLSSESIAQSPPAQEHPKNPWKPIPDITDNITPKKSTINDIISDERKQKENLMKITSKLLLFTQMEDKAIEELHKFYNTENVAEEIISVERVNIGAVAAPVWVPKTK
ncbi:unnamed protein product [Acanthoscelides obtectus]|nr:unnamed protein product [Acanthoscelides obtectus]CAK1657010.1 Inhibitor of Bruton tyrosine kinase [Acanthoscelides obtectus]